MNELALNAGSHESIFHSIAVLSMLFELKTNCLVSSTKAKYVSTPQQIRYFPAQRRHNEDIPRVQTGYDGGKPC